MSFESCRQNVPSAMPTNPGAGRSCPAHGEPPTAQKTTDSLSCTYSRRWMHVSYSFNFSTVSTCPRRHDVA